MCPRASERSIFDRGMLYIDKSYKIDNGGSFCDGRGRLFCRKVDGVIGSEF